MEGPDPRELRGDKHERPLVREARPLQIAPEFAQASVEVLRN